MQKESFHFKHSKNPNLNIVPETTQEKYNFFLYLPPKPFYTNNYNNRANEMLQRAHESSNQ